MGRLRENTASAFRALRENWLRSSLTMLGIIIGVGSVVLLVGIGQGVKTDVTRQMESLGTNVVFILPGKLDKSGQPNFMSTLGISTLTEKDVVDLAAIAGIRRAMPLMFVFGTVDRAGKSYSAIVLASTEMIYEIRRHPLLEGRFYTSAEQKRRVCVLAHVPKQEMFGTGRALGKKVRIRNVDYEVVGVLAPEEESLFGQGFFTNSIYIPFEAARTAYNAGQINRIILQTDYREPPKQIIARVKARLASNHGREDFAILTQTQLLGALYKVFNIVTALLGGISAISLVVAGIGIMNIMLVTVTERTREIGIRKTVGARRKDIFLQFLTEAVVLAFVGGVIGTLLAAGICVIVAATTPLKPLITAWVIAMAFGVCFLVGVLFGVAPAVRASNLNPIDALRWE